MDILSLQNPFTLQTVAELFAKEIVRLDGGSKFHCKWPGSRIPHELSNCCRKLSSCSDSSEKEVCISTCDGWTNEGLEKGLEYLNWGALQLIGWNSGKSFTFGRVFMQNCLPKDSAIRSTLFMLVTEVFVRDCLVEDTFARGEWVYLMLRLYSQQFGSRKWSIPSWLLITFGLFKLRPESVV